MKRFFHAELEQFRSNLLMMGERCIEVVRLSSRALTEGNVDMANDAIARDDAIDELELKIDAEAIRYISMRAPVARDLRLLVMGMKAAHDLERVGDEATSIARRVIKLDAGLPVKDFLALPEMSLFTLDMLRDSIDSLIDGDAEKAMFIPIRDKEVDRLNKQNYQTIAQRIQQDPTNVNALLDLMFVSKSLERIADHASNISEEVVYLYKAEDIRHSKIVKDAKAATPESSTTTMQPGT
jgi:phosphate transport system protein